jgi:hypothetical protein
VSSWFEGGRKSPGEDNGVGGVEWRVTELKGIEWIDALEVCLEVFAEVRLEKEG